MWTCRHQCVLMIAIDLYRLYILFSQHSMILRRFDPCSLKRVHASTKKLICHGNRIFFSHRCVSCGTMTLPSFNGLPCKLAKRTLFMYLIWVECMASSFVSFAYFTHFSNLVISRTIKCRYLQMVNGVFILYGNSALYTQKIKG